MRNRHLVFLTALLVTGSFAALAQLPAGYPTVTVNKVGDGTGTVTIKRWMDNARFVELTAIPDAGSEFGGWSSSCSYVVGRTCFLQVFPPRKGLVVTATFNGQPIPILTTHTLTVVRAGNGTGQVISDPGPINCGALCSAPYAKGTVVKLTAKAGGGQTFTGWSGGGCSGIDTCRVSMTTSTTVIATFTNEAPPNTKIISGPDETVDLNTTVNLNQHGLTGSWYEHATSGQGLAIEVFPDQTPGHGQAFAAWLTFDRVAGGAERQRWYTLQGPMVSGQTSAPLTIYQNTRGNFNASPATIAEAVGTATLRFDSCTSGELTYSFDGGPSGVIQLTRLLPNVTCTVAAPYPSNADFALSGAWYAGPATSGQGFTTEVAPTIGAFFLTWYTYIPNGANAGAAGQRWYTAQGTFAPGLRTIPVQIYETIGGMFDALTPAGQQIVQVGTGTLAFQSCSAATFSYNFTGGSSVGFSGIINLSRVGPAPPGCASCRLPDRFSDSRLQMACASTY